MPRFFSGSGQLRLVAEARRALHQRPRRAAQTHQPEAAAVKPGAARPPRAASHGYGSAMQAAVSGEKVHCLCHEG